MPARGLFAVLALIRIRAIQLAGKAMRKEDFAYSLPTALIAQTPPIQRDAGRLLELTATGCCHRQVQELPQLLGPGDLLVVNDTQVIKARLRASKDSGGSAEILVERIEDDFTALCQVRVSKSLKPGRFVHLESVDGNDSLKVLGREGEFYRLEFPSLVVNVLERHGQTPLPPYIRRAADEEDRNRYQTVYSRHPGAVAAPTAGLHFTKQLLERIAEQGATLAKLTLHVGAGTFQSVRVSNLEQHKMHSERYFISEATAQAVMNTRRDGGRVIAVGTTVVRALESARQRSVGEDLATGWAETNLFITPGYEFGCVDALVTNFHLPESSLLMLVCAFAGYDRVMRAYHLAVEQQYRFFSYGDAMFLRAACSRQEST